MKILSLSKQTGKYKSKFGIQADKNAAFIDITSAVPPMRPIPLKERT
jgi:hypothetical protein